MPITADKKLTKQERAHMAFRYLDWLLTKNIPSGGFRVLYAITQCFNEENQFHCFPSIEYLAALIKRAPSTVWSMVPKLEEIGAIEIEWGSKGSGHPNVYRLPRAFLEFYFGSEKGQTPKPVLPPKKPRQVGVSKHRQTGVSDQLENPDTPPKKPRSTAEKPRHIGVSHFLATSSHKEERGAHAHAAQSARVERENLTEAEISSDGAPSIQRAIARIENVEAQQELTFSASRNMGTATNGANAGRPASPFAQVLAVYPSDAVGNEMRAYFAFERVLAALGDVDAVLEALASLMLERGTDLPDLTDAMAIIERGE